MKIRREIKIDFELTFHLKQAIDELERIYLEGEKIEDKKSEKYLELESEFYGYTQELEVFSLSAIRAGKLREEDADLLWYKYQAFDWGD